MPIICCNCGQLLGLAFEARDRALNAVKADPNAWPGDAIVALVMASAAAEGFVNELAELVGVTTTVRRQRGETVPPTLVAFANAVAAVEKERGTTQEKYLAASRALSGTPFDKGRPPYQDFAALMAIRNDLMHLKPRDTLQEAEERGAGGAPVEWPKYVIPLQRRGLAREPTPRGAIASWFELLKSEKLASWACRTAHAIMLETVNLCPDGPGDPAEGLKGMVRRLAAQC